jgi:hypothetical protein
MYSTPQVRLYYCASLCHHTNRFLHRLDCSQHDQISNILDSQYEIVLARCPCLGMASSALLACLQRYYNIPIVVYLYYVLLLHSLYLESWENTRRIRSWWKVRAERKAGMGLAGADVWWAGADIELCRVLWGSSHSYTWSQALARRWMVLPRWQGGVRGYVFSLVRVVGRKGWCDLLLLNFSRSTTQKRQG